MFVVVVLIWGKGHKADHPLFDVVIAGQLSATVTNWPSLGGNFCKY